MRSNPSEFADGLTEWLAREESLRAEAASIVFAEVLLMGRAWIEAQAKRK